MLFNIILLYIKNKVKNMDFDWELDKDFLKKVLNPVSSIEDMSDKEKIDIIVNNDSDLKGIPIHQVIDLLLLAEKNGRNNFPKHVFLLPGIGEELFKNGILFKWIKKIPSPECNEIILNQFSNIEMIEDYLEKNPNELSYKPYINLLNILEGWPVNDVNAVDKILLKAINKENLEKNDLNLSLVKKYIGKIYENEKNLLDNTIAISLILSCEFHDFYLVNKIRHNNKLLKNEEGVKTLLKFNLNIDWMSKISTYTYVNDAKILREVNEHNLSFFNFINMEKLIKEPLENKELLQEILKSKKIIRIIDANNDLYSSKLFTQKEAGNRGVMFFDRLSKDVIIPLIVKYATNISKKEEEFIWLWEYICSVKKYVSVINKLPTIIKNSENLYEELDFNIFQSGYNLNPKRVSSYLERIGVDKTIELFKKYRGNYMYVIDQDQLDYIPKNFFLDMRICMQVVTDITYSNEENKQKIMSLIPDDMWKNKDFISFILKEEHLDYIKYIPFSFYQETESVQMLATILDEKRGKSTSKLMLYLPEKITNFFEQLHQVKSYSEFMNYYLVYKETNSIKVSNRQTKIKL